MIQQIQGGSAVLFDLVHCTFFKDGFDLIFSDHILFFCNTYCRCRLTSINEISLLKNMYQKENNVFNYINSTMFFMKKEEEGFHL